MILIVLAAFAVLLVVSCFILSSIVFPCRGLFQGGRAALSPGAAEHAVLETNLRMHVTALAGTIGERNLFHPEKLEQAAEYIKHVWQEQGFEVRTQVYEHQGVPFQNLWVQIDGAESPREIVLAGAHYDSVLHSPGADDNASGAAALLELSGRLKKIGPFKRSIRFAAFTNEEPPFFKSPEMGSRVFARTAAQEKENITAMISLETIGYFTDERRSQKYPPLFNLFYPDTGNFLAVVGNVESRKLVEKVTRYFREASPLPCECAAVPGSVPGVDWSDHASFWEYGVPAVMVTDTAPYRNPRYHQAGDTPETLTYPAFAQAVSGLAHVLERLAGE